MIFCSAVCHEKIGVNQFSRFVFLFIALLAFAPHAQAAGDGVEVLRMQAGEPDANGWYLAQSTRGGFSVLLPVSFNELTVNERGNADIVRVEMLGGATEAQVKFAATRVYYADNETAKKYFGKFAGNGAFAKAEKRTLKVNGHDALEIDVSNDTLGAMQRAVLVDDLMILLIVQWPLPREEAARNLAGTFLGSLKIEGG